MVDKKTQGKKNRQAGARFEIRVRKDLESKGWIVAKWMNNISDYPENNINLPPEKRGNRKLVKVKNKFLGSGRPMMLGAGFPDFIVYMIENDLEWAQKYVLPRMLGGFTEPNTKGEIPLESFKLEGIIIGIEVKSNGYLTKEEKEKCKWYLDNKVFSKIFIAKKGTKRGQIDYVDFIDNIQSKVKGGIENGKRI